MTRLSVELLPARQGDALWLEWDGADRRYRALVDGAPGRSYPALRARVEQEPAPVHFDMLTITHIDTDHIDGAVTLLLDDLDVTYGDIWFNGYNHALDPLSPVAGNQYLGGVQGQIMSAILGLDRFPWNERFDGRSVVVDTGTWEFPSVEIGGLHFTIIGPGDTQLGALADDWLTDVGIAMAKLDLLPAGATQQEIADQIEAQGIDVVRRLFPTRYPKRVQPPPEWEEPPPEPEAPGMLGDESKPNAASIAFLVEGEDLAVLFTGDAHAGPLVDAVVQLTEQRNEARLRLDALKLPHHGSRHNISEDLLTLLDCDAFLFSSDGSAGYHHPDDETVEMILEVAKDRGTRPQLYFNYVSHRTCQWRFATQGNGKKYDAHFPPEGEGEHGLVVEFGGGAT